MSKRFELHSLACVVNKLKELGLEWDRVVNTLIEDVNWHTGSKKYTVNDTCYFMVGNTDIAYYLPTLNSLIIHDTPRKWGETILNRTQLHPLNDYLKTLTTEQSKV